MNKHPHPLIYMRGLKPEDLVAMIDFLYFGEANVYQENLDSFLAVAEELQLKGLMGSGAKKEDESVSDKPTAQRKASKAQPRTYSHQGDMTNKTSYLVDKLETEQPNEGTVAVTDYTVAADLQHLDDQIKSMMMFSENIASDNTKAKMCKVCGKEGQWVTIRDHIEANHITGVSHSCDTCGKTTRSRSGLRRHKCSN